METREMRTVFINTLIEAGKKDDRIVLIDADLGKAGATASFAQTFPERHINVGVAEANMIGVSAGLASVGKIPVAQTFGCFASRRVFDQFFISVAYAHLPVKLVGTDPGISAAFNGGTHMPFEDLGTMRLIPDLTIVEPSDPVSLAGLLPEVLAQQKPAYIRLYRKPLPVLYSEGEPFQIGKCKVLRQGGPNSVLLIALGGIMVQEALEAAKILEAQGISVTIIDVLTLKPIDAEGLLSAMKNARAVISCENHQIHGALGSAVAELMAEYRIYKPFGRIGIRDEFGQVGTEQWLKEHFKLDSRSIVEAATGLLQK
ncbi:transketolase family protein [Gracilinema caldarium]|uniref:1-deoxy-D-xylulose-5-phosphate synthase n=1 Tax=Gracilinema caldarium (strain ATCC 51460 / DSM 7334 / H1) TaxID=744872 RepID=F8EZJ0_GRAC1|nr:transketolase C-terminal domain-containing protein [Gracilinema caldarium]AEJ20213.1 1-deoxy-D-xylulose-5-phosphate synthase [Gracilinema caldarium DSM 7334]